MSRVHRSHCCIPKKPIRKCFVKKEIVKKYVTVRYDPKIESCCTTKTKLGCKPLPCRYVPCKPKRTCKSWKHRGRSY